MRRAPAPGASDGDRGTSEATLVAIADQAKLLANTLVGSVETPAEHVRNALQLLDALAVMPSDFIIADSDQTPEQYSASAQILNSARRRLERVVELLEAAPVVAWMIVRPDGSMAIPIEETEASAREMAARYAKNSGHEQPYDIVPLERAAR